MKSFHNSCLRMSILCVTLTAPTVNAQFAVVDVGAITQLIEQAKTLEEQLATARAHLAQAQAQFASMTGSRGMERLLAGIQRNYLPTDWAQVQGVMQAGGGGYSTLASGVRTTAAANAVLSAQQLGALPTEVQQQIATARLLVALHQNVAREALATSSDRFGSLQQLIDTLPKTPDQKAVLELQARVGAETTMLQNEQTKLQTLYQMIQAEERANQQQAHERALAGHGTFANRFEPTP